MALAGVAMALMMIVVPAMAAHAQGRDCSPAPCGDPAPEPRGPAPVVVQGSPTGQSAPAGDGVFDAKGSGLVAPVAVSVAGLVSTACALGLTIRRRRNAPGSVLPASIVHFEPARDR